MRIVRYVVLFQQVYATYHKAFSFAERSKDTCSTILTDLLATIWRRNKPTGRAGLLPGCRVPHGPFGHGHGHHHRHGHGWGGPRGPFGRGFGFFGFGPGRGWGIPDELLALRAQAAEVARLFMIASRGAFENKERVAQLRTFLDRAHKELSDMIYSASQNQPTAGNTSEGSSPDVEQV